MSAPWIPPPAIPAKNDGDPLTAKDLKDVIASLQAFLVGGTLFGPATSIDGGLPIFGGTAGSVLGAINVVYPNPAAAGSFTGGIQEAIEAVAASGGTVVCRPGQTYTITGSSAATASVWLHSNVELVIPSGAKIQRGAGSLTSSIGVIAGGPVGSNGTEFSSGTTGANIRITGGGIIDGNQSNFSSNVGHGIRLKYVDNLTIDGPKIQNTEQDGIYLDGCRNFHIDNFTLDAVGQATSVTQRNGMSIYNTGATSGWGKHGTISNGTITTCGAAGASAVSEALSFLDVADIAVSNVTVDGCDYVLEFNAHNAGAEFNRDVTCEGVIARNARFTFIPLFDTVSVTWRDLTFVGCTMEGTDTTHNGAAVWVAVSSAGVFDGLTFQGCTFRNINTSSTANRSMFQYQSTTGSGSTGLTIADCKFFGKSGTTLTSGGGIVLSGGIANVLVDNTYIKDAPGNAFSVNGVSSVTSTAREVTFSNCIAETPTGNGFAVTAGTATTTQFDIHFNGCIAKNCGISGNSSSGWLLQTSVGAGAVVQGVYLNHCRAIKTSGTFMLHGLHTNPTAATTLDSVYVSQCDFSGMQTGHYNLAGAFTPTNLHIDAIPGRGADIASAATITIPVEGDVFHVTGTTNITAINNNAHDKGRRVKLIFDGALTMTAPLTNVKMAGNYTTSADDSWVLTNDGGSWNEDSRSINA